MQMEALEMTEFMGSAEMADMIHGQFYWDAYALL